MSENKYANNLKVELVKAGKSQTWLGGQTGISFKHINRICAQVAGTTQENWRKIAKTLDVSLDDLLNVDNK